MADAAVFTAYQLKRSVIYVPEEAEKLEFEELDIRSREAIVELLASIIKNIETEKKEKN